MPDEAILNPNQPTDWPRISQVISEMCEREAARYGSRVDANDLKQEVAVRILRGRRGYEPRHGFHAWCRQIVRREAVNLYRNSKRAPIPVDPDRLTESGGEYTEDEQIDRLDETPLLPWELVSRAQDLFRDNPEVAVIIFACGGIYQRLPWSVWQRWLAQLGMEPDFPTDAVLEVDAPAKAMLSALAAHFGVQVDSVRKQRDRYRDWLKPFLESE